MNSYFTNLLINKAVTGNLGGHSLSDRMISARGDDLTMKTRSGREIHNARNIARPGKVIQRDIWEEMGGGQNHFRQAEVHKLARIK
jgi:hypothetical protein